MKQKRLVGVHCSHSFHTEQAKATWREIVNYSPPRDPLPAGVAAMSAARCALQILLQYEY